MVEPIQMIMHLPIFNVKFPSIALSTFSGFVPIVNFDFLGELEFFKKFLKYLSKDNSIVEVKKKENGRDLQEQNSVKPDIIGLSDQI